MVPPRPRQKRSNTRTLSSDVTPGPRSAGSLSDVDNLTVGIVVLSAIGLAISWLLGRIERRLLAWRLDQPPRPVTSLEIFI
jgi:hypothetical protein